MKKTIVFIASFFIFSYTINADTLAEILQDLAIQTACLGKYSATQASKAEGVINRYPDPDDWYTPKDMDVRLAQMSGNMTRTNTFYGVCFDYAQFAWDDIKKYQAKYNNAGMKNQQWYIAVTKIGDPYTIILYDPVSKEKATTTLNGVPVKEYMRHIVRAHDDATGHAWLWVQHNNGTWYWIDPTWTDNTGYPWWGIVENGGEVRYYPNAKYCIASNYPRPPQQNEAPADRKTPSSSSTNTTLTSSQRSVGGLSFGYLSSFDFKKFGFTLEMHDCLTKSEYGLVSSLYLDYLRNNTELETMNALLIGVTGGYQFSFNYVVYAGGGIGFGFPNDENSFTWKVNGGLRFNIIKWLLIKLDVSYNPIIGPAFGVGFGIIPVELSFSIAYRGFLNRI